MLWKTPIYKFRIPESEESDVLKEIIIDVTGSAPPFIDVKTTMRGVFDKLLTSTEGEKINSIMERNGGI